MGGESDLLRMLEPVVRPDGVSGSGQPPYRTDRDQPIEGRSFESILDEARQLGDVQQPDASEKLAPTEAPVTENLKLGRGEMKDLNATNTAQTPPFNPLTGIDRVENDSLRRLMGNRNG